MYNLIEYSGNYLKESGSLWQHFRDEAAVNDNCVIVDFNGANHTKCLNSKTKLTCQTGDNGRKNVKIIVPLKYLSDFWRTREIPLINCEIDFISSLI